MVVFNALQTTLSGGIGRYSYELSKELYKIEDNIKIVIRKEDVSLFSFANKEDLIIIDNITSGAKRNVYEQFKLPFLINKLYPDAILHYPDSMAPLFSKNKVVITVHDIAFRSLKNVFTWKTKLWKNFITQLSVLKAYKIIAISKFTKDEITNAYGARVGDKTEVVLNGFNDFSKDEIKYDNIKKEILNLSNEKFILTVSTISPRKNIDGLIRAYNTFKAKDDYKLVVAGSYGWMYEEVFNVVKELNIADKVIFTNKINDDELKYLYKSCDMLAYVSFYEGFGLPPLEAMSYGKPCMVSNKSSIPEVVGEAALLVNPNSIEDMCEGIEKIVLNSGVKEQLSQLGLENIKRFSWGNCASGSKVIYEFVLRD